MQKNLIIMSAGKFGREVYSWAKQDPDYGKKWIIKGFLDNRENALENFNYKERVLASAEEYIPEPDDLFIPALGDIKVKKELTEIILEKGGKFTNIIHPTVIRGENVTLGTGIIICPYTVISCDVVIEDFVSVNIHNVIGHDARIGIWSQINSNCTINGNVTIGKGVYIGSNSVFLPNSKVEDYAKIGAGSVVLRYVKSNETVFGVPAKTIKLPK